MRASDMLDGADLSSSESKAAAETPLNRFVTGEVLDSLWKAPFWEGEMPPLDKR